MSNPNVIKKGVKMKKLLCVMIVSLFLMSSIALAQERPFTGLFVAKEVPKKAEPVRSTRLLLDGSLPINLSGDTLYRFSAGSIDAGVGIDLASYKDLVILRAEASQSTAGEGQFMGVGFFVNIPKLINMISGANWNAAYINPSIGVVPGYDFGNSKYDTGIVLSIIQVTF
jgi:hypothetical protein